MSPHEPQRLDYEPAKPDAPRRRMWWLNGPPPAGLLYVLWAVMGFITLLVVLLPVVCALWRPRGA